MGEDGVERNSTPSVDGGNPNQANYKEEGDKKKKKGSNKRKSAWEAKKDQEPKELKKRVEKMKMAKA